MAKKTPKEGSKKEEVMDKKQGVKPNVPFKKTKPTKKKG